MLGKILFFVLLFLLVLILWNKRKQKVIKHTEIRNKSTKMIRCPQCSIHFAEIDGEWFNGVMYCSKECLQKSKKGYGETVHK